MIEEEYTLDMNSIEKEDAYLSMDWLTIKDYEFKILVIVACYAQEKAAFRGTFKYMCELLGVQSNSRSNAKIKEAIYSLEAKGDVHVVPDNHAWTVTLTTKAEKKPRIVRIKKLYIKTI